MLETYKLSIKLLIPSVSIYQLRKCVTYGIHGPIINLLSSYLTDLSQFVTIDEECSHRHYLILAILGPSLFRVPIGIT